MSLKSAIPPSAPPFAPGWRASAIALLLVCGWTPLRAIEPAPVESQATLVRQVQEVVHHKLHDGAEWFAGAKSEPLVLEQGVASYLANRLHGRKTASGERYDMNELTAAHKTLPFGTRVIVRSLQTGREVAVRITDRGPHLKSRIIDLSRAAAAALGISGHGIAQVELVAQPKPAK